MLIMTDKENNIYNQLIKVTDAYLGPSSERFINRQIINHLNKQPSEVLSSDIVELVDWIRLAMTIITDDENIVKEYISKIQKLKNA